MANGRIIERWTKRENCRVAITDGSGTLRFLIAPQKSVVAIAPRRHSVAHNRYLLQNVMMRWLDSFQAWRWAIVFLSALAVPALAIKQQGSENREAAINMIERSKVVSDALASAEKISRALSQSGYEADFSLESLRQIDRFFEEQVSNGQPKPGGLLSQQLGARLFAIGAYVGEVIRRQNGGEWQGDDNDPQAEINIAVRLKTGVILWPVQRVMKRFKNGAEDGIWIYGAAAPSPATRQ